MPGGGPVHRVGVGMRAGFVSLQSGGNVGVRLSDESIKLRCNYPGNWEKWDVAMLRARAVAGENVRLCRRKAWLRPSGKLQDRQTAL